MGLSGEQVADFNSAPSEVPGPGWAFFSCRGGLVPLPQGLSASAPGRRPGMGFVRSRRVWGRASPY